MAARKTAAERKSTGAERAVSAVAAASETDQTFVEQMEEQETVASETTWTDAEKAIMWAEPRAQQVPESGEARVRSQQLTQQSRYHSSFVELVSHL